MKRPDEFKTPFKSDELVFTILCVGALVLFLILMSACVSKPYGTEPKLTPDLHRYKPVDGRCVFKSPVTKHAVDCDEPVIDEYFLVHSEFFESLLKKLDRCERWKFGE